MSTDRQTHYLQNTSADEMRVDSEGESTDSDCHDCTHQTEGLGNAPLSAGVEQHSPPASHIASLKRKSPDATPNGDNAARDRADSPDDRHDRHDRHGDNQDEEEQQRAAKKRRASSLAEDYMRQLNGLSMLACDAPKMFARLDESYKQTHHNNNSNSNNTNSKGANTTITTIVDDHDDCGDGGRQQAGNESAADAAEVATRRQIQKYRQKYMDRSAAGRGVNSVESVDTMDSTVTHPHQSSAAKKKHQQSQSQSQSQNQNQNQHNKKKKKKNSLGHQMSTGVQERLPAEWTVASASANRANGNASADTVERGVEMHARQPSGNTTAGGVGRQQPAQQQQQQQQREQEPFVQQRMAPFGNKRRARVEPIAMFVEGDLDHEGFEMSERHITVLNYIVLWINYRIIDRDFEKQWAGLYLYSYDFSVGKSALCNMLAKVFKLYYWVFQDGEWQQDWDDSVDYHCIVYNAINTCESIPFRQIELHGDEKEIPIAKRNQKYCFHIKADTPFIITSNKPPEKLGYAEKNYNIQVWNERMQCVNVTGLPLFPLINRIAKQFKIVPRVYRPIPEYIKHFHI